MDSTQSPSRISQKTFWASVTASIIASIIFGIFFQPIIAFVSNVVITTVNLFYYGWIDHIYRQAAGSTEYTAIYEMLSFITIFPMGFALGVVTAMFIATLRFSDRESRIWGDGFLQLRLIRGVMVVLLALVIPYTFIANSAIYTAFQATATFDQRLRALAPVISDQERKTLIGAWAVMKGRSDYDKINARLEELSLKYHTTLPRPYV